ncbi:MAG: replicative DNA helicase [Marinilabiliaceae bacterium]|nr:replicative DNA helicase [Marinilabiliaceae bacterium]
MAKREYAKKDEGVNAVARLAEMEGKMPPQSIEFEEAVLGALMLQRDAFQDVVEILQPQHFYLDKHQRIYTAMQRLNTRMEPTDMLMVYNELTKMGELELAGGHSYLVKLTQHGPSAVNIVFHANIIFQKYVQRALIHLGTTMQSGGYDDSKDVEDLLEEAESGLFEISQNSIKKEVVPVSSVIGEAIRQMEEAAKRKDGLSGIPSGFTGIDALTSGWQPATMVVIAARPAMGKTAFVLSMARRMAIDFNVPIAVFSLEMSNTELVKRLLVAETEIPMEKIKNGRLTKDQWEHFNHSIPRLNSAPIFIDDTPGLSVFDLRSKARILKKKHDIKMIIIDYLQLMTASGMKPGNRQEEVSMISRSLKGLAKELNIPIVALSQLNRGVEQRTDKSDPNAKRPQLSDLRESGAIEQDADMVCFIHRPEYYGIKTDADGNSTVGLALFIIAKHRSGAVDDIRLRFTPELVRFDDDIQASSGNKNRYSKNSDMKGLTEQTFVSSIGQDNNDSSLPYPDGRGGADINIQASDDIPF